MRLVAGALAVLALALTISACVPPVPETDPGAPPVGPVPAPSGPITLDRVTGIVSEGDASGSMSFSAGDTVSTSGDDLASESDYWIAVGGRPEQCAGVVSAPYLVSAHDTGERLDDPSALIGTFTELDEDRFGLIQVYARQFDGAAIASGFFDEFTATVGGCPAYQLVDGDTVTYDAVSLSAEPRAATGAVAVLSYSETLADSAKHRTMIWFLQRDGIVIALYGEIFPSSTITADDLERMAGDVALRLDQL